MKSTTKNNLSLSTNEIAILVNKTRSEVYYILSNRNIKPIYKDFYKLNYYSIKDIYTVFDILPFVPIIKKPKKQYFEFSNLIVESKINQNGID